MWLLVFKSAFLFKGEVHPDMNERNRSIKVEQKTIKTKKLQILGGAVNQTQIGNSITYLTSSSPVHPLIKNSKFIFALKEKLNHTFALNIIIANMFDLTPARSKSIWRSQ